MSALTPSLGPLLGAHPSVRNTRLRQAALLLASALVPLALALAVCVEVKQPNYLLLFAVVAGAIGVVVLMTSERYDVTLTVLVLFLGMLDGPVKLLSGGGSLSSGVRDLLILSISVGALMRLVVRGEPIRLPPLSAWALGFAILVALEAFNPKTAGAIKVLAGFRQQLEWVPFFFFGYALMRSKQRFRRFFLLLGVIALANGVVGTYQTRLTPQQLAAWGPGYRELILGTEGLSARVFASEGVYRIRPPALGKDAGFGGGVGTVALPAMLALLAIGPLRRRWPALLLLFGALAAVVTGLGRIQVIAALLSVAAFAGLSFSAGRRVGRPLAVLLGVTVLALPAGLVFVSAEGSGTFSRYDSLFEQGTEVKDTKTGELLHLPTQLAQAPFGVGLGTVGAASGFGGHDKELIEGHGVGSETEYNFLADEVGLPGLLLWVALTARLLILVLPRLRRIPDFELRLELSAVFSTIIAMTIIGFSGPTTSSGAFGPFFWGAVGIAAYWFVGPGRAQTLPASARAQALAAPVPA